MKQLTYDDLFGDKFPDEINKERLKFKMNKNKLYKELVFDDDNEMVTAISEDGTETVITNTEFDSLVKQFKEQMENAHFKQKNKNKIKRK